MYGGVIDKSLIATLTESNHVYTSDLDERVLESSIFEFRKYKPVTTSAIFGQFMLRNLFDGSYSVDQLIAIYVVIEKHYDTMSYEEQEIRRRIMTFGTLSKIFPTENRQRSYPLFYDKLKRQVPRVEGNPHYWLQYAMGVMSTHNLPDAERLLRTAYSKAERIEDYDTTYIDNQFARLNLNKAIEEKDPNKSFDLFLQAHAILRKEEDDVFKFRQAGLYIPYYQQRHGDLSNKNRAKFEHAVKEMLASYRKFLDVEYALEGVPVYQEERLQEFAKMADDLRAKNKG